MRRLFFWGVFVSLAVSIATVSSAASQTSVGIEGFVGVFYSVDQTAEGTGLIGLEWSAERDYPYGGGLAAYAQTWAKAKPGVMGTYTYTVSRACDYYDPVHHEMLHGVGWDATASATASYTVNDLCFDLPGLTGTSGTMPMNWVVTGDVDGRQDSFCGKGWGFGVAVNGMGVASYGGGPFGVFALPISVDIHFTYGVPFDLTVSQASWAHCYAAGDGTAVDWSNLGNTTRWMGFGTALDSSGNPVTNYTVESDSDIDWTQSMEGEPLPEPCGLLVLSGALAIALRVRRRR